MAIGCLPGLFAANNDAPQGTDAGEQTIAKPLRQGPRICNGHGRLAVIQDEDEFVSLGSAIDADKNSTCFQNGKNGDDSFDGVIQVDGNTTSPLQPLLAQRIGQPV